MSNTIQIKRSSTSGSAPTAGQLAQGELAVNLADEALYTKDASNAVVKLNAPSIDDKNTGATKHVTIASGGNVGIGTSSPTNVSNYKAITVNGTTGSFIDFQSNGTTGGRIQTDTTYPGMALFAIANQPLVFGTNGTERARIDSSGNLLVGATSATPGAAKIQSTFDGAGQNGVDVRTTYTGGTSFLVSFFNNASSNIGSITTNGTTVSYVTSSDYRLKENITPMTGALAKVAALKPVTYKWKSTGETDQGFIAHELAEVVPQCVTGEKDAVDADGNPKYQGIDTSFLVATLTAAIQEQQAIITALTARVEALEAV
jgi:hypothetical protein